MKNEQLTNKDFFFCYSKHLAAYIEQKGISYITVAKNIKTDGVFSMFPKSDELNEVIKEYNKEKIR